MKNFSNHRDISAYARFFEQFHQRNLGQRRKPIEKNFPFIKKLPGLFSLLSSFSAAALNQRQITNSPTEWNPISQRVFFKSYLTFSEPNLVSNFDEAMDLIERFVELSHEAMHVLLWEPFFVGKWKNITSKKFIENSLYFEGFCFWYADIIVTMKLRKTFNNGEFVRLNRAVSQHNFHPYRAFEMMKITNKKDILDIYMDAFNGERTAIYKNNNLNFVRDIFMRFAEFYLSNLEALEVFKKQLKKMEIFGDFQKRFCLEGLPTLLPSDILSIQDMKVFCHSIYDSGLKYIDRLQSDHVEKVRMRRAIQLRAYTAYSLKFALKNDLMFSLNSKKLDRNRLTNNLQSYLQELESCIQNLKNDVSINKIQNKLAVCDKFYEEYLRKFFLKNQTWMAERNNVYPLIKHPLRLLTPKDRLSKNQIQALSKKMLAMCNSSFNLPAIQKAKPTFARNISHMLKILTVPNFEKNFKAVQLWKKSFNRLMLDPIIMPKWTLQLSEIDPVNNRFREILFEYK